MASRDFLGRFGGEEGARAERAGSVAGESDEVELSLGLSLGGCFGADPARDAKKQCLERSSSIASICSLPGSDDLAAAAPTPAPLMRTSSLPAPLMRTSSLPTETEEERGRWREMQSLKRLEAKRKRLERRNSMNSGRSGGGRDDGQEPLYPSGFQLRRSVASQGSTSSSMTEQGITVLLVLGCVVSGGAARPLVGGGGVGEEKAALQTSRPFNIAHRGSNGELPEETAAAYMRAIDEGADFIESDISATKDGHLVCVHDMTLDDTTDVADHKEFAGRRRTLEVQWANVTGYFITDFTLAELKSLRAKQRWEFRDKSHNGVSPIITFDEFINIALNAKRVVGIYPEMKNPVFINKQVNWADGKKYEDKFIATLKKYGYGGKYMSKEWLAKPLFIQSFAPTSLIYAADLIDSPKVFLIDDVTIRTEDTNQSYDEITSDEYLDYMKEYVVGVGPWKDTVVPPTKDNKLATPTDLVAMAHARGLQVHPYTYRNENQFLHFNFRQDPYAEYDYWLNDVGVDGLFTDFPASLRRYQEWTANKRDELIT